MSICASHPGVLQRPTRCTVSVSQWHLSSHCNMHVHIQSEAQRSRANHIIDAGRDQADLTCYDTMLAIYFLKWTGGSLLIGLPPAFRPSGCCQVLLAVSSSRSRTRNERRCTSACANTCTEDLCSILVWDSQSMLRSMRIVLLFIIVKVVVIAIVNEPYAAVLAPHVLVHSSRVADIAADPAPVRVAPASAHVITSASA